jgi:predicted metal-dependent phosphoesterase TrpH/aminoglycoside phosphotransferase
VLLETHSHTAEHSRCSRAPAAEIVRQALERNLEGVVLTDHHYRWDERELAQLRRSAGVPDHFVLLSGQEVSTADLGHVLVYGTAPALAEGLSTAEIRERLPEAALVRAHPYRHRLEYQEEQLSPPVIDAVEIFSANHSMKANSRGLEDWHRFRFTALAGTDAHGQLPAGTYPTQFDHPVGSIDELAREIRGGRCRPFLKEITRAGANAVVTEVVIGTKGEDERRPRIVLRRLAHRADWARALRASELGEAIAAHGFATARFRIPELLAHDAARLTIIEQGLRGRSLVEKLRAAGPAEGRLYLELAAGWLARLHDLRLALTPREEFLTRERRRLEAYAERLAGAAHPRTAAVRELAAAVLAEERRLARERPESFVQCHGDFHPKNVIVGQDNLEDQGTAFIAAIDLENAILAPRAFDVGWFLAHYRHQLAASPEVLAAFPPALFLAAYRRQAEALESDFAGQVGLFTARAQLSVAAYLVRLGLGADPALERLLADAREGLGAALSRR